MADETPDSAVAAGLSPVQARTLGALRRSGPPRVFDSAFIAGLREDAQQGLAELTDRLALLGPESRGIVTSSRDRAEADRATAREPGGDGGPGGAAPRVLRAGQLFVTKHAIRSVLACEAHHLAPAEFTWSPARARGQVSHKAIQLLLSWRGEPTPIDLVDDALGRLADEERSLGDWLAGLGPADAADVRGQAVERVTKFLECFPPLDRRWHPMTEAAVQFPADGAIVLRARVDLVLGRPAGAESRKVIVDLKSGRIAPAHREDLRFYALVETLCREVPPRRLASFSLDSGEAVTEDVTEGLLRSALRRTLDAIERIVELRAEGRPARRSPGVTCRWCTIARDCPEGMAHIAAHDGDYHGADEP